MTNEQMIIKAVEDCFVVGYDRFISNGNSHEVAIEFVTKAICADADSEALKRFVHAVIEVLVEKMGIKGENEVKILIYTRGNNAERQIEKCEAYAKAQGYSIFGAVNNDDDMAVLIASGKIDALIVSDKSRVSRLQKQYDFVAKMLQGYGVKLIVAEGK